MKKLALFAAAIAATTLAASAAEVYSSNIVGYQKLNTGKGYTMVGVPFQTIGSTDGTINIQDAVNTTGLIGFDWTMFDGGDKLSVWDASRQGYTQEFIWAGTEDTTEYLGENYAGKWLDSSLEPANIDFPVGSAFWVESSAEEAPQIVLSGEIAPSTVNKTFAIIRGDTMLANPFPFAFKVNNGATYSGLVGFDWTMFDGGDRLSVWDPSRQGYTQEFIWAGTEDTTEYLGENYAGKWLDSSLLPTDFEIPVGGAFWINSTTTDPNASITFNSL